MKKTTGTRTATTHTLLLGFSAEQREGLTGTYRWPSEEKARETITMMVETNGFEHTAHFASGLEVHAFYVNGELATVVEIADDTAARVHSAVRRQRPVTISYVTGEGEETVRTIEPRSVQTTKNGDLIVKALDRKSELHRTFRLDRVTAYTVHRTRFLVAEPVRTTDPETGRPVTLSARESAAQALRTAPAEEMVEVCNWDGSPKFITRTAYDLLMGARDPREPLAKDELVPVVTNIYSTDPETAAALEAPEEVQNLIAERYAFGHRFAFVSA